MATCSICKHNAGITECDYCGAAICEGCGVDDNGKVFCDEACLLRWRADEWELSNFAAQVAAITRAAENERHTKKLTGRL